MIGRRVFQPFGISQVSEEVEELQSETIEYIKPNETFWEWFYHDWIEQNTSISLTGFIPEKSLVRITENVIIQ